MPERYDWNFYAFISGQLPVFILIIFNRYGLNIIMQENDYFIMASLQ